MPNASVGSLSTLTGGGARRLFDNDFNVNALRPYQEDGRSFMTVNEAGHLVAREITANALLRKDEWKQIDTVVVETARRELTIINDLRSAGLTRELGDLGTTIVEYERSGDMDPAQINMSGVTKATEDTLEFDLVGIPLPITHKQFRINLRRLLASRRNGGGLDTSQVSLASRIVAETLDEMVFRGNSRISVGGTRIYGLINHPDRNTGSLAADWLGTGANPLKDVMEMVAHSRAVNYRGPFTLYVSDDYWTFLQGDYKPESDKTVLERILDIREIQEVKPASSLASGNVVLVQLTPDVVQLGEAQDITVVDWDEEAGFEAHFKVFAGIVPIVKSTHKKQSGVTHYTKP